LNKLSHFSTFLKWGLIVQFVFALLLVIGFVLFSGPIMIGAGKFNSFINTIETTDYWWWVAAILTMYFGMSFLFLILNALFNKAFEEVDSIKENLLKLVKNKKIPIRADINERIMVKLDKPVEANFKVSTKLDINQSVHVKAVIPVKLNFPIDTIFEAKVLGLGTVKIPIKTTIPMNMDFPFEGDVAMNIKDFKLELNEKAFVEIPPMEVPINCQVEAKLNLESNLQKITDSF
jgi:hypothetical protein